MSDMNGHEGTGVPSDLSAGGVHAFQATAPTIDGLNRQQRQILQHLQTGETITPLIADYRYGCKSLSAVISGLKKKGWDVRRSGRKDKDGNPFSAYWLPKRYTNPDSKEDPGPLFDDVSKKPDAETSSLPVSEFVTEEKVALEAAWMDRSKAPRVTNVSLVKEHLIAEKTISTQTAMELYAIPASSLRACIATLRKDQMPIETIRVQEGDAYYNLVDASEEPEAQDWALDNEPEEAMEAEVATETPPVSEPPPTEITSGFATMTGVRRIKDGIEIGLDDKLFCIRRCEAHIILTMLRHFLDGR